MILVEKVVRMVVNDREGLYKEAEILQCGSIKVLDFVQRWERIR